MKTISVISLDLGGKYTGFFSYTSNDFNSLKNFQSGTINYDESFILSQVDRRAKRHTKRNLLRRKLVKRLFLLILKGFYNLKIDYLPDEILGLFNKRGYTYASFELKEQEQEALSSDILKEFLNEKLNNYEIKKEIETEDYLNQIASKEEIFNQYKKEFTNLFETTIYKPKKNLELRDEIKETYEKQEQKELLDGLKVIKEIIEEFDKEQNQGNLPRAKYFLEINEEIKTNSFIQEFLKHHNLKQIEIQNLIGNISNFQLKELRRYFNDINMAKGDIWLEEKLHKIVYRFITSWHCKKDLELKKLQDSLLDRLNKESIIDFLTTTNPKNTIPPYDDMNNRGAVKCHSLRLSQDYLNLHLPNWRNIANALSNENQKEDLKNCTTNRSDIDLTLLHRVLDVSSKIDPYKLREFKIENYIDILGKDSSQKFLKFTKDYYETITKKVRTGIWQKEDDIFEKCNHNPPYKNNQIHTLISAILGVEISDIKFKEFENTLWKDKFGNKKLSTYCKNIEELRKKKGNLFKIYLEDLNEIEKPDKEQKSDLNLLKEEQLIFWVDKIAEFFNIDKEEKTRFQNHFSMAQLYTIIETKRSGFMSTCKWCSAENSFRGRTNKEFFTIYSKDSGEKIEEQEFDENIHIKIFENSNAQRLPADTQRPFSGKIERYLDKLAYEIVKIKAKELENIKESKVDLKIVLEQNSFEYEESIRSAKIKNANAKANKNLEDSKKFFEKSLEDKETRIKEFNDKICLYCNKEISTNGEIDHILPRSYTLKNYGTVFNSEGNLLYVHQECNQRKKDKIYKIEDITASININEIEEEIRKIKLYKTFTLLSSSQQKAFKQALFLPNNNEAYKKVLGFLRTDQSSRVNGTQKYLAKKIQEKLKKMLPKKEFDFEFILASSEDVSRLRDEYAKQNPLLTKPKDKKQTSSSHTIDAIVALSSVYKKVNIEEPFSADEVLRFSNMETWSAIKNEFLAKGKTTNQKIENMIEANNFSQKNMRKIFTKPIFGENALGERYKPIVIYNDTIHIGYPRKIKNAYDFRTCKQIVNKNDKTMVENIIKSELAIKNDKSKIIIYEINKSLFNELSSEYFNLNYENLINNDKEQVSMLEFIIKFNKYYTKKVDVKFAPSYKKQVEEMKFPFYNEWKLFDEAWQYLKINENQKDFKNRYIIDKSQENSHYKIDLKKGEYKLDTDSLFLWNDFCKWYFLDRFKKDTDIKTIRKKARKHFSLIAEGTPQGRVFRLKRKTPQGFIYQAIPIDNKQIAGDYSNILLYGNKKTISLVSRNAKKELNKKLEIKTLKDIRDIKVKASKLFKDNFDYSNIEVILNKTSVTVKNFPLDYFKENFIQKVDEFSIELNTLSFTKKDNDFGVIKSKLDSILLITTRSDQNIKDVLIEDNFIEFKLPFKNTSKLLDD